MKKDAQKRGGSCPWPPELVDGMVEAFLDLLTSRARKDLELRVRSGTGTEDKGSIDCCATGPARGNSKRSAGTTHTSEGGGSNILDERLPDATAAADASKCCTAPDGNESRSSDTSTACRSCPSTSSPSDSRMTAARGHHHPFTKDPGDTLGELLDEWTSRSRLRELVVPVAERSASVYAAAIQRGERDGLSLPSAAEAAQLRRDVTTEALLRTVQSTVSQEVRKRCLSDSHEGGLLANPSGYRGGHLDYLLPETIRGLMVDGVGLQSDFVGEEMRRKILRELELLEFDGAFSEVLSQNNGAIRTDSMCWRTLENLDREKEPGLSHLFKCMGALPFELNKKANLCLQASWTFHLACYSDKGAYYKKHMDSGFDEDSDNGRKVTCIYYPNASQWDTTVHGGALRLYGRETYRDFQERKKEQKKDVGGQRVGAGSTSDGGGAEERPSKVLLDVTPKGDCLVLFRSREVPHEVLKTYKKRFAVSLWITGPAGPGDT